ncbi:hypothetical protein L4D17_17595 [Vibrio splendidus]|uniref:hypothetical protein n=1 Tax=Vibrio TaxID=662 RepID=UPI00036AC712|nr:MULTISPECIES: hypothetical protein [Vibrio]OED99082.1 hypothetical protein OAO_15590 [Vibrio cyclitrophicus ZF28]TKG25091.1 hypothetical protein FCV85_21980 [Vibrio sp. F13]
MFNIKFVSAALASGLLLTSIPFSASAESFEVGNENPTTRMKLEISGLGGVTIEPMRIQTVNFDEIIDMKCSANYQQKYTKCSITQFSRGVSSPLHVNQALAVVAKNQLYANKVCELLSGGSVKFYLKCE